MFSREIPRIILFREKGVVSTSLRFSILNKRSRCSFWEHIEAACTSASQKSEASAVLSSALSPCAMETMSRTWLFASFRMGLTARAVCTGNAHVASPMLLAKLVKACLYMATPLASFQPSISLVSFCVKLAGSPFYFLLSSW